MITANIGHITAQFPESLNDVSGLELVKYFRVGQHYKTDQWKFRLSIFKSLISKNRNIRWFFLKNQSIVPLLDKITFGKLKFSSAELSIEDFTDLVTLSTDFLIEQENNLTKQLFEKLRVGFYVLAGAESQFRDLKYKDWLKAEEQYMLFSINRNEAHLHRLFATLWQPKGLSKAIFKNNHGEWNGQNTEAIRLMAGLSKEHKQIMLLWYVSCIKLMKDKFKLAFPRIKYDEDAPKEAIVYTYSEVSAYIDTFMQKIVDYAPSPKEDDIDGMMNANVWNVLSFVEKDLKEHEQMKIANTQ